MKSAGYVMRSFFAEGFRDHRFASAATSTLRGRVESARIEVVANPLPDFSVTLMLWIIESFEYLGVPPGAADILGRTTPGRLDEARISDVRFGSDHPFDLDRMLPAVAKVMEIA